MNRVIAAPLIGLFFCTDAAGGDRVWTDSTGIFSTTATYVDSNADFVRLKTLAGETISVPHEKLSINDRTLVAALSGLRAIQSIYSALSDASFDFENGSKKYGEWRDLSRNLIETVGRLEPEDAKFFAVALSDAAGDYGKPWYEEVLKSALVRADDIELLATCYKSKNGAVKNEAISAAVEFGPKAHALIPLAEADLNKDDLTHVRFRAAYMIAKLDPARKDHMVKQLADWHLEECRRITATTSTEVELASLIKALAPADAAEIFAKANRERGSDTYMARKRREDAVAAQNAQQESLQLAAIRQVVDDRNKSRLADFVTSLAGASTQDAHRAITGIILIKDSYFHYRRTGQKERAIELCRVVYQNAKAIESIRRFLHGTSLGDVEYVQDDGSIVTAKEVFLAMTRLVLNLD